MSPAQALCSKTSMKMSTIVMMSDLISMTFFFFKKKTDLQDALKFNFHNCISILYNTILNMAIFQ